ncbi:MAG: chorismate mutase [Candidatus Hadarchaeales archaeon]
MKNPTIEDIRKKIDVIDQKIVELVAQRIDTAKELAKLKKKLKLEIRDERREREVIERAKRRAVELGIDQSFVETLMRYLISSAAAFEKEVIKPPAGWEKILAAFKDYPAQLNVVRVLFDHGLRVREDGEIACGDIKVPAVHVAEAAGVDRRVVKATAKRILENKELMQIFGNLEPTVFLKSVAHRLGLGVIEIIPEDAARPGIISEVAGIISQMNVSIRQAIADDPYLVLHPKLTIITDAPVPGEVIEKIRKLGSVRSVIVY